MEWQKNLQSNPIVAAPSTESAPTPDAGLFSPHFDIVFRIPLTSAVTFKFIKAQIVHNPNGGPVRTILNFNPCIPSGRYWSFKTRRPMDWEAFHERHLYWICDADARVRNYLSQPHRLDMFLQGRSRPLRYFPDLMRQMQDGTTEIIETKKTRDEVSRDPEYELKLEFAKDIYEKERGWTFRVMTAEEDIEVEPLLSNARTIKRDGSTRIRSGDFDRLGEALGAAGNELSYAESVAALTRDDVSSRFAQAKLHALIVRRFAFVDIRNPICNDTPVLSVDDPEYALPASTDDKTDEARAC